jgi:catechol 2,3-dioxygenase-like lactoylglutathione lyase family enzyme
MFTSRTHSHLYVTDQDEAIDFYVGKLGLEVRADVDLEFMRWLTVGVPGDSDQEILLEVPGGPNMDADTAEQVRELLAKGVLGMAIFTTDDCHGIFEELSAKGVEFTQEPVERFYGIDCGIRDPFGNHLRITQPAEMPDGMPAKAKF